jgi:CTP:phosphocholine cytidylyltransferase-like protein
MQSTRSKAEWVFTTLEAKKFSRTIPKDNDSLIIRETNASNIRIYWKSMAEMFIPLSLFESTMHSDQQIFEAISLEELRTLMQQYTLLHDIDHLLMKTL